MRVWILATAVISLTGCGTITRGTQEDLAIDVQPADAQVTTSIGMSCVGPCVLKVPRKQSLTVTAAAPGYEPQSVAVGTRVSGGGGAAMAGNILFGGLIGAGVDATSGAMMDHYPNPVIIRLRPVGAPFVDPPTVIPVPAPAADAGVPVA